MPRKHCICDFTGLPHVKLIGNVGATASIYPFPMSDRIADELAAQAAMWNEFPNRRTCQYAELSNLHTWRNDDTRQWSTVMLAKRNWIHVHTHNAYTRTYVHMRIMRACARTKPSQAMFESLSFCNFFPNVLQTKPSQAMPSQAKPSQARQSQAKQSRAKPKQSKAQPNNAWPNHDEIMTYFSSELILYMNKQSNTKTSQAKPSKAKQSH